MSINTSDRREKSVYEILKASCNYVYIDERIAESLHNMNHKIILFKQSANPCHDYNKLFFDPYRGNRSLYETLQQKYGKEYTIHYKQIFEYNGTADTIYYYQILYLKHKRNNINCLIL